MTVQLKKLIKKAKTRAEIAVPFMTSDVDVVLKLLSQKLILILNQHLIFLPIFQARFWGFFTLCKVTKWSVFLLVSLSCLGGFHQSKPPLFLLGFLSSLRGFSPIDKSDFFLSFLLSLGSFFLLISHDLKYYILVRASIQE